MTGILARGDHRLATVTTVQEGWEFVRRNVKVDLVFVEPQLPGDGGIALIQRLKNDCVLKALPIVVYAAKSDPDLIRRSLDFGVQNFLLKPYHDDKIFAEIAKFESDPWRKRHFEEEKSFCRMMGLTPPDLHRMLRELGATVEKAQGPIREAARQEFDQVVVDLVAPVLEQAEAAGAWGIVECLNKLTELAQGGLWHGFTAALESLDFATRMIPHHLDDSTIPVDFLSHEERNAAAEARERAFWEKAPFEGRCPVLNLEQLKRGIDALRGCPVIDTAAAEFQMSADGQSSCINPLMDLVARDPGLTVQMLIAANKAHPPGENDFSRIEDPRLAIGQLGELRLQAEARNLLTVRQQVFELSDEFNWPRYWTFQRGVARIAQHTCRYLEFYSLEPVARTAGQIHDLGRLLLAQLHPAAFRAILGHARKYRMPLRDAERLFLDCTTKQLGTHFAEKFGLSTKYANVMRWIDDPESATEDANLVAIISLSRDLCRHNKVGASGNPPLVEPVPLEETAEWRVLRESVFPSFNLKKFEQQIHADCRQLQLEFAGRESNSIASVAKAALV